MVLGLYPSLHSSNRKFSVPSKRETAKIAKTPEIFKVCIFTEGWTEQDRSVISLIDVKYRWDQCAG